MNANSILEIGFFLAGLLAFLLYGWKCIISYQALKWPATIGKVTQSYVEITRSISDGTHQYQAIIKYNYKYLGKTYSGEKGFGKFTGIKLQSEKTVSENPEGMEVTIRVNPEKHKHSVLQNGFDWGLVVGAFVGLFFIAFSLFIAMN